jgi:homoaconitase/3-isopropylmalate dehydratase large subunit
MTLDQVKEQLQAQYQIENFIDLSLFDQLPTGRLYSQLRRCHKTVFADNERVVFVIANNLKKTYTDQPNDIVTVLQQYIQHHDIPHFFIIVLSNINDISQQLNYVHKMYNPQEKISITHRMYD